LTQKHIQTHHLELVSPSNSLQSVTL
jgi:hypothetical protein